MAGTTIENAFRHRSGRVVATSRFILSIVFFGAIWLDPSQPALYQTSAYATMAAYILVAGIYLVVTWDDWRLDWRLAGPAHVVDILMFTAMVYLTEGYTSPFYTHFVFLILAAAIRWSWKETALTAGIVVVLFFGAGVASLEFGSGEFDLQRFMFRGAYLLVVSMMMIWFGINQRESAPIPYPFEGEVSDLGLPAGNIARFGAANWGAARALFVWRRGEEPWHVVEWTRGGLSQSRLARPGLGALVHPQLAGRVFLFDIASGDVLFRFREAGKFATIGTPIEPQLAERLGLSSGIAIPIEGGDCSGLLFVPDVRGMCIDDLRIADHVGNEASTALVRALHLRSTEEAAVTETRLALARDLHDSVAQILAGTAMQLESIRRAAAAGRAVDEEIRALQAELALEQRDLRGVISRLRTDPGVASRVGLVRSIEWLAQRLQRQWGVPCAVLRCPDTRIDAKVDFELHQLVREAASNAVRHGSATAVEIELAVEGDDLVVGVSGDGVGQGEDGEEWVVEPRSLAERIRRMGGRLSFRRTGSRSTVEFALPAEVGE